MGFVRSAKICHNLKICLGSGCISSRFEDDEIGEQEENEGLETA